MTDCDRFQVIRFLISLAHFDGEISLEEKKVIAKHLKVTKLTSDQKFILSNDLKVPINPIDLFEDFSDPRLKRYCLEAGRILIHSCKADEEEKYLLKHLTEKHFENIDEVQVYSDVNEVIREAKKIQQLRAENLELHKSRNLWRCLAFWNWHI